MACWPAGYTAAYASAVSYDWSGISIGGQLGAANARNEWTNDFTLEKVEQSTTGLAGGAHAGLQKQWSWIVAGVEVSYLWMDRSGSVGSATVPGVTLSSHVRDVTLVSGKFGWTWGNPRHPQGRLGHGRGGRAHLGRRAWSARFLVGTGEWLDCRRIH